MAAIFRRTHRNRSNLSFIVAMSMMICLSLISHRLAKAQCLPEFSLERGNALGWQGGDAAYSIPLPDGRDVWVFGDTLYGPERKGDSQELRQVHNSLGISTCENGTWKLGYVIQRDVTGKPVSYFTPKDARHWYWALDGFYANGDLWVTLLCLRRPRDAKAPGLGFESCGADLAQISHLERDPHDWQVTVHTLVRDGVGAYPSATTVVDRRYAYLFALYEDGGRPLLATRIPLSGLSDPEKNLEYLAADGVWKQGFDPKNAKEVMAHGGAELSIRYRPELHQWRAVLFDPAPFSSRIIVRTSPSLTGPWTEGDLLYSVPEMQPGPDRNKNVFCYAGKEHPEFEKSGDEVAFTYVCNTMDIPDLVRNLEIYRPRFVRKSLKQSARK